MLHLMGSSLPLRNFFWFLRVPRFDFLSLCFLHETSSSCCILIYIYVFQESLDNYLLGQNRVITNVASSHLFVMSKEMEELVCHNFHIIEDFKMHLLLLNKADVDRSSVKDALLSHFDELFTKVSPLFYFFIFRLVILFQTVP